jgi:hypothetical protein
MGAFAARAAERAAAPLPDVANMANTSAHANAATTPMSDRLLVNFVKLTMRQDDRLFGRIG